MWYVQNVMRTVRKPLIPLEYKEGVKEDLANVAFELDLGGSARFLEIAVER